MFDPRKIIQALNRHKVEYVTIGGFAATLYGCRLRTVDALVKRVPANHSHITMYFT